MKSLTLRNGVTLEYVERGDRAGLPVVLLHGVADSWRSFEGVLPNLPSSLRVLAPSQRGHGESSRPETGYRFDDFSSDLGLFLDALEIRAVLIIGHSMGSAVAQRFAINHPDRTIGLVLMGSCATFRDNPGVGELWDSAVATLTDPVDPAFVLEFQQGTLARPVPPAFLDTVVRESLKVPVQVWRAAFTQILEADFSADLERITAPTLIIWGDRDALLSRRDQDVLRAAIRGSRVLVYPGAGHGFHWEDPARFASDLVAFAHELPRPTERRSIVRPPSEGGGGA